MIATYQRDGLVTLPGAVEAVTLLAARYPLALASSSPRDLIVAALRITGLAGYFKVTVSSDDVSHGKPSPDVYLLAAERLGVAARDCAAIEDSSNGIRSAVATGMITIAVPHAAYPPAPDALALARLVLPNLRALTPETIQDLGR